MRPLDRRAFKETLIERVHLRSYYSAFTKETLQYKRLQVKYVLTLSEKKVQKLSLGRYPFERYTFVPYLPLKVHFSTLKVHICTF